MTEQKTIEHKFAIFCKYALCNLGVSLCTTGVGGAIHF